MPTLRPYQDEAVRRIVADLGSNPILVAPTGSGKTVMGVAVTVATNVRTLWVAHRRELIHQAARAVVEAGGDCGIILAGEDEDPLAPIQVASVQTLARRELPHADLLVIDEAHHATSDGYKRLVARYPRRIGLTATPFRLDGKGLADAGFGSIVVAAYTDDLCAAGTLHDPIIYASPPPDLKGVRITAGDYNLSDLGKSVRENTALYGRIVSTWKKRAEGKRTVAFAVDIAHAESIVAAFRTEAVPAEIVTGATPKPERAAILARLAHGITLVVVNVGVLTEGWDLPALECAILARPTASLNLHLQTIGRIMRACDGKLGAILLDHAGNTHRHGLVTDRLVYSLHGKVKKAEGVAPTKTCPECARVIPAGVHKCPECGYVFPQKDKTEETDGELVLVGAKDSFDERARRFAKMYADGMRISRWKGTTNGGLFDPGVADRGAAIAASNYKKRYGTYPLNLGPRLLEADRVTPYEWDQLRAKWRRAAEGKGFDAAKTAWFVRTCERNARGDGGEPRPKCAFCHKHQSSCGRTPKADEHGTVRCADCLNRKTLHGQAVTS